MKINHKNLYTYKPCDERGDSRVDWWRADQLPLLQHFPHPHEKQLSAGCRGKLLFGFYSLEVKQHMIAGTFKEEQKCETQALTCFVGEMFHSSSGRLDVISPWGLIWQPASLSLTSLMPSRDWKTVEINKPSTLIIVTILSHYMIMNYSHVETMQSFTF